MGWTVSQRNLLEVRRVLKETEAREDGCMAKIAEQEMSIKELAGDVAVWSEKCHGAEEELEHVGVKLVEEENGRLEAEALCAERLEETERVKAEYEELAKSSSETKVALEAQVRVEGL